MRDLGVRLDKCALERLRRLVAPWGGELRLLSRRSTALEDLTERAGYSWAPFVSASVGLGIHYRRRLVLLQAPIRQYRVHEIIHEMAHVFASKAGPSTALEWPFLGWEMVVARTIGLPWAAWKNGNNYQLWDLPRRPAEKENRWAIDVQGCTDAQLDALLRDRLKVSRYLGQVDAKGRPRCVRR